MSDPKTVGEFVALVEKMRVYQQSYFDNKNVFALNQAKKYEGLVDKAIRNRNNRGLSKQPELTAQN